MTVHLRSKYQNEAKNFNRLNQLLTLINDTSRTVHFVSKINASESFFVLLLNKARTIFMNALLSKCNIRTKYQMQISVLTSLDDINSVLL